MISKTRGEPDEHSVEMLTGYFRESFRDQQTRVCCMTRGRRPEKGMADAIPLARTRGSIMKFLPDAGSVSNFVINGGGLLVFVRIRNAQRLYGTLTEMEAECREPVSRLRSLPGSGPILRELWCYSRHGNWRYFRVGDSGITEIGPQGLPVTVPAKDPAKPGGGIQPG